MVIGNAVGQKKYQLLVGEVGFLVSTPLQMNSVYNLEIFLLVQNNPYIDYIFGN